MPLLWHLPVSHFSEKVRWALDHKRVDHVRRSPLPGAHIPLALVRSRGASYTLPLLELGSGRFADSTAAIAALEEGFPERPLYPADPEQRRHALALEDHFDENLGPSARAVAFHELGREPRLLGKVGAHGVPEPLGRATVLIGTYASAFTAARYGLADPAVAARARAEVLAAFDLLEAELEGGDGVHLVGDSFSVADLTAAALFYPIVCPPNAPLPQDIPLPAPLTEFIDSVRPRPGFRWVEDTYRRYRLPA